MNKIIFIIMICFLISCGSVDNEPQIITDDNWYHILNNTLPFTEGDQPYIFNIYDNNSTKGLISDLYYSCTNLGYEYNDSIDAYIKSRNNKIISNKLDTMFSIKFISDTNSFKNNYIVFSEPFFVNDTILCISMINKIVIENKTFTLVFFLSKRKEIYEVLEFYDVRKDRFFRPTNI